MALAATSFLGLLLGWSVRGLRLRGRLRKSEGERNIAVGSLEAKEAELEALYAAGRGAPTDAGGEETSAPNGEGADQPVDENASAELTAVTDELARTKAELKKLQEQSSSKNGSESAAAIGAAVASVATAASLGNKGDRLDANLDEDTASLEWRNRYLESRVRNLEETIQGLSTGSDKAETAAAIVPVKSAQESGSDAEDGTATSGSGDVEFEMLKWQNEYLKTRASYFETHGGAEAIPAAASILAAPEVSAAASDAEEPAGEQDGEGASDEEIASLRWRNRYLEGRLAYYEGDKAVAADGDSGIAKLAENTSAVMVPEDLTVAEPQEASSKIAAESEDDQETSSEPAADMAEAQPDEEAGDKKSTPIDVPAVSEAKPKDADKAEQLSDEKEVPGVQPIALPGPVGDEGDDLTAIGGIGPKIEQVLNSYGIYHYDQIAAWTPENIQWVDNQLAFEGRIEREQWVQQAEALSTVD